MRASAFVGPMKSELRCVPIPQIADDEVLIRVVLVGICASELDPWRRGDGGPTGIRGHEPMGYIEKVGKNVTHLKEGDRVTALGRQCFAEYAALPARVVTKIPDNVADEEALGEPISCLVSAADRTPVRLGDSVAIVGLGYMGLVLTNLIALKGPGRIIGIDLREECADRAMRHGANEFYLPSQVPEHFKLTRWDDMDKGYGLDIACEVTGKEPALALAGELVHQHGVLNICGYHQGGPRSIDMQLWNWKALTVINGHERRTPYQVECMERAMQLLSTRKMDLRGIITHEFPLERVDDAFGALINNPKGFVKAAIRI